MFPGRTSRPRHGPEVNELAIKAWEKPTDTKETNVMITKMHRLSNRASLYGRSLTRIVDLTLPPTLIISVRCILSFAGLKQCLKTQL